MPRPVFFDDYACFPSNSFKKDKGKIPSKNQTLSDCHRRQEKQFSIFLFTAYLPKAMPLLFGAFILANFSAEISLKAELSSLGVNSNRTFFNEQFRLHSIDRNYLKSAING